MEIVVLNWRDLASPQTGGAEVHLHEVFARLASRGHRVLLISTKYPGLSKHENIRGLDVLRVGTPVCSNVAIPWSARQICRQWRPDIVVDCLNKLPFFAPMFVPCPVVGIVHHLPGKSAFHEVLFPVAAGICLCERLIPHVYADTPIIAISRSTRDDLVLRGLTPTNISVIELGVDHKLYRTGGPRIPSEPLIVHVGRLRRYKQIDHAIKMLHILRQHKKNATLVVIGEGKDEPRLRRVAACLQVDDAVVFKGKVSDSEKLRWIQRASVAVSTSVMEGWGLSVIEANACGVPVVAYDVPGLRDSVTRRTGRLVPLGDIERLAAEVLQFLRDDELRRRCSQQALVWSRRFTWERCADETLDVLRRSALMSSRRSLRGVARRGPPRCSEVGHRGGK